VAITRTRVADDTWVFTSALFAEVNAGLVVSSEGGILIDTLPFPSETKQIIDFAAQICPAGIRFLINTISHADHVYGSCFFPDAELIAHESARELLIKYGRRALVEARQHTTELLKVEIRLPKILFNEGSVIRLGDKTVHIMHSPGPGPDVCVVHVREEKVLFASDLMMPVPVIATPFADIEKFKQSLHSLHEFNLETIVQGHGDILLRGEVTPSIEESIQYLDDIVALVERLAAQGASKRELLSHEIEEFGRNRIPLGGLVQNFHQANLLFLWERAMAARL
jgi:glyoxylase-like metal-dependent hydrolase (beta-lactamase superfamily II)